MNDAQKEAINTFAKENKMNVLAFVPWDQKIIESDMLGVTPLKNREIEAIKAIDNICQLLMNKNNGN